MRSAARRPAIFGHRGGKIGPPNSSEAVRSAAQAGADGVEIDVQLAGDGTLIARHDPGPAASGETIEQLTDVLGVAHRAGIRLLIDFKSGGDIEGEAAALSAALSDVVRPELIAVSSFSIRFLERFRQLSPGFELYPIVSLRQNFPRLGSLEPWAGVSVLAAVLLVNPLLLLRIRRRDRRLLVWFGLTEWPVLLRAARRIGADAVIVARVGRAHELLGSRNVSA